MKHIAAQQQFYVDVRHYAQKDELSYDLSQHLPRRLAVGPIMVVADNPAIFLSVIRKRLARMQAEIEREHARTLNRHKKMGFIRELVRLNTACFTTKSQTLIARPDVLFTAPHTLAGRQLPCQTIYIATAVSGRQLHAVLRMLVPGGLVVIYGEWQTQYAAVITALNGMMKG